MNFTIPHVPVETPDVVQQVQDLKGNKYVMVETGKRVSDAIPINVKVEVARMRNAVKVNKRVALHSQVELD